MSLANPIEDRKTVIVTFTTATANPFTQNLYVPFEPDEMIVRAIQTNGAGAGAVTSIQKIWCDIIQDYIGTMVSNNNFASTSPQSCFPINSRQRLTGNSAFRIENLDGTITNNFVANLALTLEFVRYKRRAPITSGRKAE